MTKEEKSSRIWDIEVEIAKLKDEQDKLKEEMQKELTNEDGVTGSYKDDFWEVHYRSGSVSIKFDEATFQKNEPEAYKAMFEKYSKTSTSKATWNWTKQKKIIKG